EPPRPDIPAPEPENATRRQNSLAACCVNWRGAFGSLPFGKLPECNPLRNNTRRSRAIHLELGRAARVRVRPPTSVRHDCESRQFPYTAHPLHTEQVGHLLSAIASGLVICAAHQAISSLISSVQILPLASDAPLHLPWPACLGAHSPRASQFAQ